MHVFLQFYLMMASVVDQKRSKLELEEIQDVVPSPSVGVSLITLIALE